MFTKTNNTNLTSSLSAAARNAGILLMATAATVGMLELPEHLGGKIAVATQPAFAFNPVNSNQFTDNTLRREREETGPHYVSYSINQRTPSRTGNK